MNLSRYNVSTLTETGEHLLYNTSRGTFGVFDEDTWRRFEKMGAASSETPPENDDVLSTQLREAGFLTELSPEEELVFLRSVFETQRSDRSELGLVLAPTYACNYRCPYCYELGHNAIKGKMDERVMDAVCRFVRARHAENPLATLFVQWYGGDPSLALDVVQELSARLIRWCDENDVLYDAMILTNCNLIDVAAADLLARARVSKAFITIDGFERTHNARRVAADGSNSFERNVRAARLFADRGIQVIANMNADRVNIREYRRLREYLREAAGAELSFGRLCDYGHFYGTRGFAAPDFDLFTHEEFCQLKHDVFAADGFEPQDVAAMLAPCERFCNGQRDNYFVIDCRGDVYLCDGYIGEQDHVAFSIFDAPDAAELHRITHDPFEDAQCSQCKFLPQCWGNCVWERRCTGMVCHPLKTTIGDYLRDWRSCYGKLDGGFTRLA